MDWSSKDWDSTKAKAGEQTDTLINFNEPRPQTNNNKTTDIGKVAFSKLQIGQSDPKEELIQVTDSLIPPPLSMETPRDMPMERNYGKWKNRLQKEEEKYNLYRRVYVGHLSKEEKSDMDSDCLTYSYFT